MVSREGGCLRSCALEGSSADTGCLEPYQQHWQEERSQRRRGRLTYRDSIVLQGGSCDLITQREKVQQSSEEVNEMSYRGMVFWCFGGVLFAGC